MKKKMFGILSVVLSLAVIVTFAACTKEEVVDESTIAPFVISTQETEETEPVTVSEIVESESVTTEAETQETEAAAAEIPTETGEILKLYNSATEKTAQQKVSFKKHRETTEKTYEAGFVLEQFKPLVYEFMGIGSKHILSLTVGANAEDYSKYFLPSKLTTADVKSATCTADDNGNVTVSILIKDGNSSVVEGEVKGTYAPIDKCGISAGLNDKDWYDHKSAQNVIAAIDDFGPAAKATINESYSNAKLTAVIDANGNLTSLVVTFDFYFDISSILGSSGIATASTKTTFSDFKW